MRQHKTRQSKATHDSVSARRTTRVLCNPQNTKHPLLLLNEWLCLLYPIRELPHFLKAFNVQQPPDSLAAPPNHTTELSIMKQVLPTAVPASPLPPYPCCAFSLATKSNNLLNYQLWFLGSLAEGHGWYQSNNFFKHSLIPTTSKQFPTHAKHTHFIFPYTLPILIHMHIPCMLLLLKSLCILLRTLLLLA